MGREGVVIVSIGPRLSGKRKMKNGVLCYGHGFHRGGATPHGLAAKVASLSPQWRAAVAAHEDPSSITEFFSFDVPIYQTTLRQKTRRVEWCHRSCERLLLRRQNLGRPLPCRRYRIVVVGSSGLAHAPCFRKSRLWKIRRR